MRPFAFAAVVGCVAWCGLWIGSLSDAWAQGGAAVAMSKGGEAHLRPPKLPALASPMLAQEIVTLKLPGSVNGTAVGGGGRYIILHLQDLHKLAVFDANAGKIKEYVPLDSDDIA